MRLVILCEGETEKRVLRAFLAEYCKKFQAVRVQSSDGNNRLLAEFKSLAERELSSKAETVVFCLIDLLQAPFRFPRQVEYAVDFYHAQYVYIQQWMRDQIDEKFRERFYAFPVVMELETWLLADAEVVKYFGNQIQPLPNPEGELHPADKLKDWMWTYKKRQYSKTIDGVTLFKRASAQRVYDDNCPHFVEIVNTLLELQGLRPVETNTQFQVSNQEIYIQLARLLDEWNVVFDRFAASERPDDEQRLREIEDECTNLSEQIFRLKH